MPSAPSISAWMRFISAKPSCPTASASTCLKHCRPQFVSEIATIAPSGLGVTSADQIEIVTGDKASDEYADKIKEILSSG